jgi:hypothetical protein
MLNIKHAVLLGLWLLATHSFAQVQESTPRVRSVQEGQITIKTLDFGPGQHHLTVEAEAPQTLASIPQVWTKQANTLCEKPSKHLHNQAELRWITVKDPNGRDAQARLFVASGVVLCAQ